MKNRQTNRHKNPLFMRLIAMALTCAMAVSASNVSAFAADMLGDSSAYSSADASLDVSTGDSSSDPADSSGDSSGTTSADASDSSSGSGESTGAEDASAGEEENATEDTGDPADEAEGDESAADESAEDEANAQVSVMAAPGQGGQDQGGGQSQDTTGNAGHIDIGVDATASVTIGSTTYSSTVGITSEDFTSSSVTITATQGSNTLTGSSSSSDWSRTDNNGSATYTITNSNVDFVYNLSDLSSSSGDSGISQVRIGGCFPVGTSTNQVYYTLTLTKEVTLYAELGEVNDVMQYSTTDYITVTVTLTATFGYWDEDNDCPGLNSSWSNGYFCGSNSGLDFVLESASATRPMVTVNKVVVDEDNNVLTEASGESFSYSIVSTNNNVSTTETGSVTVGSSGVGVATTDVTNSSNYTVTETSYPDTIGEYTFVSSSVSYDGSTATITNVYGVKTTSIDVEKVWSDTDYNGKRPSEITVNLLANGEAAEDDDGNTITLTLNDDNSWKGTFTDLPVNDDDGNAITYTVEEDTVAGYTSVVTGSASAGYTITNTYQTGTLTLNKVVKADSSIDTSGMTFTFYVVGENGELDSLSSVSDGTNSYSVSSGVATVKVPANGTVTLVDLPVGTYTVYESSDGSDITANGYTWTVSGDNNEEVEVTDGGTASATITNTITGEAVVFITKNWDDQSNKWSTRPDNDGTTYYVTLTGYLTSSYNSATGEYETLAEDENGDPYEYQTTVAWNETTNAWEISLSGVVAYDPDGNKITYVATETDVDGYELDESNSTLSITPADENDRNVTLTNTLQTANVTVTKVVVDSEGNELTTEDNDDNFRFALYDDEQTAYGTVTLTAGGSYTFENIPLGDYYLTEYLVGNHVHTYDTTSTKDGDDLTVSENWVYDSTEGAYVKTHTISFTLDEDDEGLTVSVVVTNQEEEISVDLATLVNGEKTLESDNEVTKTFTYTVKEASIVNGVETEGATVATGTATVSDGETVDITWENIDTNAFTYTEVGTYYYVIYEDVATGTGTGGIVYDATRYTLTITVTKDENGGGLIATASMTMNVQNDDGTRTTSDMKSDNNADSFTAASTEEDFELSDSFTASFTNTYDATETSIILRASKVLTGRTLEEGEFSIVVQELDDSGNAIGDPVTRTNGATGAFGYEIVYDAAGTYIYKVSEEQGSLANVDYDGHYYIVYIYVEDQDGVLTVTGTDVGYYDADDNAIIGTTYSFDSMTFTNTYTAEGSGTISTYKVMQGRDFNAGETFTFTITAMDSAAPTLTDPGNGVDFTDNGDGTYTVTVTVPGDVADGTTILNEVLANIEVDQDDVGSWIYTVYEKSASETNGMTLDTAPYGHLITVTVADDGDGTMTVTTKSTNDTDWNGDGETDTASSVVVNTFAPETVTIYGNKTWVDGGASHDNTTEVELTLYYRYLILANEENGLTEDTWTDWAEYTDSYTVTWGTLYTNDWHIADLPVYTEDGYEIQYSVLESEISGYVTAYDGESITDEIPSSVVPEDNSSTNRYTITNTIKQEYMTISGTKTWVEPDDENGEAPTHDNADELVLTVTRNSETTDLTTLNQVSGDGTGADDTYIVVWDGDAYSIYWYKDSTTGEYVGLPVYDASGYTYYYNVAESYAADYADDYADYTIETDWELVGDNKVTFDFTNRAPDDEEEQPVKTETTIVDGETDAETTPTGKLNGETVTAETALTSGDTVTYDDVAVGDTITYSISYYNNANTSATITITDKLDSGLTYVENSASDNGVYDEATRTITWTLTVDAFTSGSVTVTVLVNSDARSISSGETAATVDNQATVYNAGTEHTATTNIVTNPLEDDEDEETTKGIISVTYEDEEGNEYTRTETDGTNVYVQEGDQIHYIISRYNNTNESATFVIVDTLDEGVTYTYSSAGSTYYDTATTVTVGSDTYDIPARSVVWIVSTNPYSYATVQMTVTVNSTAKTAEQTYTASEPGTTTTDTDASVEAYDSYTYTTTASVANQAVAYTVGNTTVSYSNVIENPLEPDDPVAPVKSEPYRTATDGLDEDGNVEDTNGENGISDETVTYETVGIGALVEYEISYYNHNNTAATVTITDTLDENVQFVDASGVTGSAIDEDAKANTENYVTYTTSTDAEGITTITWTIYNATPLTSGSVKFQVQVLSSAGDAQSISNQASVQIGNASAVSTNTVENPVDDEPEDPQKEVSDDSAAGVDGDNVAVGDEITYEITYYNHNSEAATIKIEDTLDPNVELVGATDKEGNSLYDGITGAVSFLVDSVSGKVTWTFTAEAYESGTVTITVRVKEGAKGGTVTNQASVQVGNDTAVDTNVSENPVDDDPEDPVKTETKLDGVTPTGTIDGVTVTDATVISSDDTIVYDDTAVGEEITYTISYYNHYGDTANVTITDILDEGATYVSSSDNGVYTNNTRTVTWTIENVAAYAEGTVTLTVRVNSTAKTITVGETEATVDNQATVTITEEDNTYENTTNVVVNPLEDDDPTDPTKTETSVLDDSTGTTSTAHATDSVTEEDGTTYVTYGEVGVGDQITYRLSYTNHMNGIATITIEDVLDEGVTFVSASDGGTVADELTGTDSDGNTYSYGGTVTWTIENVDPYGTGYVTLTVKVNENAKTTEADETEATVENSATETNSLDIDNEQTTNVVINPLEDDEPETPTKTLEEVTYADSTDTDTEDSNGNLYVHVGDTVTYSITYYNNLNEVADVVIEDMLDAGVTFVSLTDENGGELEEVFYYEATHSVKYTAKDVAPLTGGTVYLTVTVNENAKSSTNTYTVNQNADSDYSLTYGVEGDTTASIVNQASTTVVSTTIGNQTTYYSNVVENPLEEDEPEGPVKTETEIDNEATTEPDFTPAADEDDVDTYTYDTVGLGEEIEYTISYYNYHNTVATITITDELDSGVAYVEGSASDGGVYDAEKHTITWELTVEPLTEGTVSFEVLVTSDAQSIEEGEVQATVDNQATVVINEEPENKTNIVVNPLDPDEEEDPVKTVSTSSAAGVNGANVNVGDQITYVLTYYNHNNQVADVSIEDALDVGLTYVSSTNGGVYDETTHTVTWAIDDVAPYTGGTVELTVEVNANALTKNVVENDADVTIGGNKYTTNLTTNPVNDEPEDPTKTLTSVTDENGDAQTAKDTEGNTYVSVGDTVTYAITYYNNLNEAADVTIEDELDRGVTFVSLTDENGKVLDATYNAHTITYTVEDVPALTEGTVYLTVTVNEYAKYSTNTYVVSEGYSLTYGVNDTIASIANQAAVTVGNQATSYTNVVEDPLEEDEPEDPTKTETTINTESAGEGTETTVNGKDVVEYGEVDVDDSIRYSISYYNYHNTTATITITDELDDGVTFVRASDGGVYDVDTHTITWNLTVEPLTSGTVSFRVIVNETAKTITEYETTATVDNDATVVVDDGTTENKYDTDIVVNPIEPDDPEDPEKAVTSETGANNANVNLGDQITYTISYYNHTNSVATVIIEDELDEGVDFVEATDGGTYDEATHTVTWTITDAAPYTDGSVDLTVKVNENASTEEYTVENDAYVTIGTENKTNTNVVTNPVNDEPEAPVKELDSVTYAEEGTTAASDDNDNLYVHVGDTVTYSIEYYNNLNEVATVTIEDVLDEGVTFQSATGVEKDDATEDDTITYELTEDEDGTVTVTWTVANVEALYRGTVELTVTVNENAKASENTYDAQGGYELIYDTTASIANQASTKVESATVTNQATYYSNVVENPLEEEEPVDPVKTAETVEEEAVEPTVTEDSDGTEIYEYDTVSIGESVTYTISYYNHHNTEATITIVDPLDEGLTYEDGTASDGGVYDETTHTITWTLTVAPLSGGTVSFQAMVNENAKTIETAEETVATVENGATETNSEDAETGHEYKTNIVVHPIDPEDPSEPQKFVSTSSEAGVSGDNVSVGDQITYVITYYNHTNTTADVTVVDTLMDGVTFVSATNDGAYDSDTHTVTWTIADVAPYSGGTVNLTIEVTDDALTVTQVENDAAVTIGDNEYTTNLVVNPVDDEPQDPVKSVDVGDGTKVSAGDQLTYTITYYNNLGTAADVTITDELDSDVTYVSSSDGGVYDSDTHTVTWTIEDVDAYTEDSVTLTVKVKSGASGSVTNTASVQIADNDPVDTNEVENPIPTTTTTTTTTSKSSSPKTGDSFQLTLWVLLLAGSAAGLLALYFRRRNSDDAE